jgi:signal peptidase II
MKLKNVAILVAVLVVLDQALKIWIKTHLCIDESIEIFPWFQLRFVENNGAAFGMQIANNGGFDWGKLLLSSFRMVMIGLLGYYICHLARKREGTPRGVFVGLAMIFAGALGNLLDSLFYGMIFTASTPLSVATFGEGYGSFLMGKVVDMFYFPLFQWNNVPGWLSFLVDHNNYFFGAIFNLADSYICVAAAYLLLFQWKSFDGQE